MKALPKVFLVGAGTSGSGNELRQKIAESQAHPQFRKASRNMLTANLAIQNAIADSGLALSDLSEAAFILGSSYGELENTTEFLKHWVRSRMARPLLFQSSLHNGTLGFLALYLSMPGPSFTISQRFFSGEKSLDAAADLIRAGTVDLALIVAVDVMSELLFPALKSKLPEDLIWSDGAAAVVLANETALERLRLRPRAELISVVSTLPVKTGATGARATGEYYDSDGLAKWIAAVNSGTRGVLELPKPDGSISRIEWR